MDALMIIRMTAIEFADVPTDDVTDENGNVTRYGVRSYIELTKHSISQKRFGKNYEQALALLTAHKMKMAGLGHSEYGTVGDNIQMNSYSEGETSISFSSNQANNMQVDGELSLTAYGLQFLTLRRTHIIPILNAGER